MNMARMHARRKGKSGSKKPQTKKAPEWVSVDKAECEALVIQLAKEGKGASAIGRVLRDAHGVPSVRAITGKTVTDILKENKLQPDLPEDMMSLIKRAVLLRKHLDKNKKDLHNKRSLALIEAKIRRLQSYYKKEGVLPQGWFYDAGTAALLVK